MTHHEQVINVGFGLPPGYTGPPSEPLDPVVATLVAVGAFAAIGILWCWLRWSDSHADPGAVLRSRLTQKLVLASARLAGRERSHLLAEWTADLAGTPEENRPLDPAQQLRYGRGCLWAAVRLRSGSVLDDALASTAVCAVATGGLVVAASVPLVREHGLTALLTNADELAYLGGLVFLGIRWARKRRGVTPATGQRRTNRDR